MARGRPVEPELRAKAVAMMREGKGRNEIARETGIAAATITKIAAEEGHAFDMASTETAVAVAKVSRAARRGAIIDRLYARTEKILDRLEADSYTYSLMGPNGVETVTEPYPPAADEKNFATSIHSYLKDAADLELVDDGDGLAPMESMLGRLAQRFGLVEAPSE